MEDFCWNCLDPSHHRRDCPKPRNPDLHKVIQKAFRAGSGQAADAARKVAYVQKVTESFSMSSNLVLPPACFYEKEVDRLDQVLFDLEHSVNELPRPISSVSADTFKQRKDAVTSLKDILKGELENVRVASAMKISYGLYEAAAESTGFILLKKIQTVEEKRSKLSDTLNILTTSLKSAEIIATSFEKQHNGLMDFINAGIDAYGGRPLKIPEIVNQWEDRKKTLRVLEALYDKYAYLFSEDDNKILATFVANLKRGWKVLKEMKSIHEAEVPKVLCKICYAKDIEYVLTRCGHVYCGGCLNALQECAVCRGGVDEFVKIYF